MTPQASDLYKRYTPPDLRPARIFNTPAATIARWILQQNDIISTQTALEWAKLIQQYAEDLALEEWIEGHEKAPE